MPVVPKTAGITRKGVISSCVSRNCCGVRVGATISEIFKKKQRHAYPRGHKISGHVNSRSDGAKDFGACEFQVRRGIRFRMEIKGRSICRKICLG